MVYYMRLLWLAVSLALIVSPLAATIAPFTVSPNRRYSETGRKSIDTTSTYSPSAATWEGFTVTIPYSSPKQTSSILAFTNIDELNLDIVSKRINFTLQTSYIGMAALNVTINSNMANRIKTISLRYFVAIDAYGQTGLFAAYSAGSRPYANISLNNSYSYVYSNLLNAVNTSGGVSTYYSFTGLDLLAATSSNLFDLGMTIKQTNSTAVNFTLFSKSTTPTYVYRVTYMWMSYNTNQVNKANFGLYELATISATNSNIVSYSGNGVHGFNTFAGLVAFSLSAQNSFSFSLSVTQPYRFDVVSEQTFASLSFRYVLVNTYYCSYLTPYLLPTNNLCYDVCPQRYFSDDISLSCLSCPIDCNTCLLNGNCLTCNALDYRSLKGVRCVAIEGYYDDHIHSAAKPCMANCSNCSDATSCSTCLAGNQYINHSCIWQNTTTQPQNQPKLIQIQTSDPSTAAIVGGCLGAVIFIILSGFAIYKYRNVEEAPGMPGPGADVSILYMAPDVPIPEPAIGRRSRVRLPPIIPAIPIYVGPWRPAAVRFPDDYICSICYDEDSPDPYAKCGCNHFFHLGCIFGWKQRNRTCPLCVRHIASEGKVYCFNCKRQQRNVDFDRGISILRDYTNRDEKTCPICI